MLHRISIHSPTASSYSMNAFGSPANLQCWATTALECLGICLLPPTVRSQSDFIWKNFHSASGMIARRIAACTVLFRSLKPPTALGRLLHFRFVGKFIEFNKSCAELRVAWDGGSSYQAYADKLKQNPNLSFYHAHSRFYHGPQALISEGFMQAIDWTHSHDEFTSIAPAEKNAP